MRFDWLISFIVGVFAMAGLGYLLWRSAGQPPPNP